MTNPFDPAPTTTKAAPARSAPTTTPVTAEVLGSILADERANAEKRYASIIEACGNEIGDNRKMISRLEARITELEDLNWQPKAVA